MTEKENKISQFFILFFLYLVPMFVWNLYLWSALLDLRVMHGESLGSLAQNFDSYRIWIYYSSWALLSMLASWMTLLLKRYVKYKEKLWSWLWLFYFIFLAISAVAFLILIKFPIMEHLRNFYIWMQAKINEITS